jgi:hypothetical protein
MVNWLIDRERRERRELVADTTSGAFLEVGDAREEPLRVLGRRQERAEVRDKPPALPSSGHPAD